ncbi:MAG: hypothetical protein ABH857_01535 [Elusimicrobiota bacterium]
MKIKISISLRMFILSLTICAILFTAAGFYYLIARTRQLNENMVQKIDTIIKLYKPLIVQNLIANNDLELVSLIERLETAEDITYSYIINGDRMVLAHSDVYEIGKIYNDDISNWTALSKGIIHKTDIFENESYFSFAYPLIDETQGNLGFLYIRVSRRPIIQAIELEKQNIAIFASVFSLVFIIILLIFIHIGITHPLRLIREGLVLMKNNLTEFKFKITTQNEIGDIYRAINELVGYLGTSAHDIKSAQNELLTLEENRLENTLSTLYNKAVILIADEENKIIFANNEIEGAGSPLNSHIMDYIKNSDIIHIITEAHNNKGALVTGNVTLNATKHLVKAFVLPASKGLPSKTVLILDK